MTDNVEGAAPLTTAQAVNLLLNKEAPATQEAEPAASEETAAPEPDAEPVADAEEPQSEEAPEVIEDEEPVEEVEEQEDAEPLYTVKIDGQEAQVELRELVNGYQRQSDYSRKMNDLSAKAKQVDAEIAKTAQLRDQYIQALQQVEQTFAAQEPTQEQWKELYDTDPIEYVRAKEAFRTKKEALTQIEAERKKMQSQKMREMQNKREEIRRQEYGKLIERVPEWKDEAVYNKETAEMLPFLKSKGFSDAELSNLLYAHQAEALRALWLLSKVRNDKTVQSKKTKAVPKPVRPGQPKPKSESQARMKQAAFGKLSRTGKINDAVDFLLTSSRKG